MRTGRKIGRNEPCPCGSGKKYKKCCLLKPGGGLAGRAEGKKPAVSAEPSHLENSADGTLSDEDIDAAKRLVADVARCLQRDAPGDVIEKHSKELLQTKPRLAFALLHLLLERYAPDGRSQGLGDEYRACLILLEEVLTEIRYSIERNRPWAIDLAAEIQEQIAHQAFRPEVDARVQEDLVATLHSSKLKLHPAIKEQSDKLSEYYGRFTARGGPPDLAQLFEQWASQGPKNPFDMFEDFMAQFSLMPPEGQLFVIAEMLRARQPLMYEVAALMLLHPDPTVRTQVPAVIEHLARPEALTPVTLRRLIGVRNWVPEAERAALDELIKKMRTARVECAPFAQTRIGTVYASTFDGAGAQGTWLVNREKRGYQMVGVLVKQGQGIREAWGRNGLTKREVDGITRDMRQSAMAESVQLAYLDRVASHFIWLGLQQGNPPPPALLQVAEARGGAYWTPQPVVLEEEIRRLEEEAGLQTLDPEVIDRVLDESEGWPATMAFAQSWFEDDARVDELLHQVIGPPRRWIREIDQASELIMEEILAQNRTIWCERLLWMALWAKAGKGLKGLPWRDFLILARELHQETPLEEIPLMYAIAERSIYSAVRRAQTVRV